MKKCVIKIRCEETCSIVTSDRLNMSFFLIQRQTMPVHASLILVWGNNVLWIYFNIRSLIIAVIGYLSYFICSPCPYNRTQKKSMYTIKHPPKLVHCTLPATATITPPLSKPWAPVLPSSLELALPVLFSETALLQPKRIQIKIQLLFRKTKLCSVFPPPPLPFSVVVVVVVWV